MTDGPHVREELAAYVLGALDPGERRAVESHVTTCAVCRDELAGLSGMPALLDRLTPQEVTTGLGHARVRAAPDALTADEGQDRSMQQRLRRWQLTAAVASCVAALAVLALIRPFGGSGDLPDPLVSELEPMAADAASLDGTVSAYAWEWGTTVEVDVAGLPQRSRYVLWAVAEDGERHTAGVWGPTPGGEAQVRGASAIQRDELQAVEVRDARGDLLSASSIANG